MKNHSFERYYTVEEVAKILKVSPRSVYRWIEEEKIFAYHLSDPYKGKAKKIIPRWAIEQFLQQNTPQTTIQKLKKQKDFLKHLIQNLKNETNPNKIKQALSLIETLL